MWVFVLQFYRVRCIGFSRRRRGRGGRIVLDRISTNMDEFWANLDYTIYSGNTKLTAKEICRQHELKKLQQQESIVNDKSQSIVIDLEPPPPTTTTNTQKSLASASTSSSSLFPQASASSDDKMENIVIKTEEKTSVTVMNECPDTVNRTKANNANAIIGKHFDVKRNDVNTATTTTLDAITNRNNGTVNIINTDNNNNSGNNSNSSKNNSNSSSNTNNRLSNINNMFRLPSNANAADVRRHFNLAHSSPFGSSPSSSTSDNVVVVDASENTSTNLQQSNNSLSSKA